MTREEYWAETPAGLQARLRRQAEDRSHCFNDAMELLYSDDVDEILAEIVRLHLIVRDPRTAELMARVFADRAIDLAV